MNNIFSELHNIHINLEISNNINIDNIFNHYLNLPLSDQEYSVDAIKLYVQKFQDQLRLIYGIGMARFEHFETRKLYCTDVMVYEIKTITVYNPLKAVNK